MYHAETHPILNDKLAHNCLVAAIAVSDDRDCAPAAQSNASPLDRISLSAIAKTMCVPVALAAFCDENGVQTFATHGLDLMNNLARFASACNELCGDRALVIPDTNTHETLGMLARHWPSDDIRFLVAIPLRNQHGERVGSLAVMNTSKAVAESGISFRNLIALGRAFTQTDKRYPAKQAA